MIKRINVNKRLANRTYHNMYSRCYRECYKKDNPSYEGVTMCDDWLDDPEEFFEWMAEEFYIVDDEKMDLDKDILVKGNKLYSPETCCFVPHRINLYFEKLTREPVFQEKTGKYRMDVMIDGKNIRIGLFDTEEEAKLAYIKYKEADLISLANEYKGRIPDKVYKAILNRKITLDDWDK